MSELPPARFRKTKSEKWAVMAPVETLEAALAGDGKVQVLKRSGDYSSFTVGSLGKPFDVDGVSMCYGYSPDDTDEGATAESGGSSAPTAPPANDVPPPLDRQPPPPAPDESEPLPEYQGGAEDEWTGDF